MTAMLLPGASGRKAPSFFSNTIDSCVAWRFSARDAAVSTAESGTFQ